MVLPKLDIPVNLLTWEISLPDKLELKQFAGNALAAELFPALAQNVTIDGTDDLGNTEPNAWAQTGVDILRLEAGQIGGIVADPNGAVVTNALVTVSNTTGTSLTTRSDGEGRWVVSGVQPGPVRVTIVAPGFSGVQQDVQVD